MEVSGGLLLKKLNNESGGHRIQRISLTGKQNRVHTSTVTVSILKKTKTSLKYDLRDEKYFYIEWFSGTGKGGQHRNKHMNSCRIYHIPTGIIEIRQGRERNKNLKEAKIAIINLLDSYKREEKLEKIALIRKNQIGSGMRADKRRTYRFQDDRVIDHITGKSAKCSSILKGNFEKLW